MAVTGKPDSPWWKGKRGEWYVAGQTLLIALVFLGPRTLRGWPPGELPLPRLRLAAGALLILLGCGLFLAGAARLGRNLAPLPSPKEDSTLVQTGAYAIVRHPLYASIILASFGWALMAGSYLTLGYAALLFVVFDFKARHEERLLGQKFPGYAGYRRRVRKFVPFIY